MEHGIVKTDRPRYDRDRPKADKPLLVQDLTFRDGHQSLFATRGRTEDMVLVAEKMDQVGFWAMEVWGGATFDVTHRFLNEDPWERLRTLRGIIKNTKLSMLLRGQNLVGYRNYPDDVVEAFVERAAANGIDVFRVFDALNDFRNFLTVAKVVKESGKHFQGTICYSLTEPRMGGDVYNLEYYVGKAKALEDMGADSICIKDMAGLMAPYDAFDLVTALKETVNLPIHLHSHATSGMAQMTQLKAIEAGVDIVDTCMAPYALRTSHPPIEPLVNTLLGTNRDTGFDLDLLAEIDQTLEREVMPKYRHLLDQTKMAPIDINVLLHQTPGGMLSNLVNQLREMDALDRIEDVFEMLPRVRKDVGQVPLVTPTSQIVGTQAVNNVLFGTAEEPYKMITNQVKDLCFGLYGQTPRPIDEGLRAKALKGYPRGEEPITERPAEVLEPELEKAAKDMEGLARSLEDTLIYALYPVTGKRFLRWKYGLEKPPAEVTGKAPAAAGTVPSGKQPPADMGPTKHFDVLVDGEYFSVEVAAAKGGRPAVHVAAAEASPETKPAEPVEEGTVVAPMPGLVISLERGKGDKVQAGDTILVLEAMKMQNAITAPTDGVLAALLVSEGQQVERGTALFTVE